MQGYWCFSWITCSNFFLFDFSFLVTSQVSHDYNILARDTYSFFTLCTAFVTSHHESWKTTVPKELSHLFLYLSDVLHCWYYSLVRSCIKTNTSNYGLSYLYKLRYMQGPLLLTAMPPPPPPQLICLVVIVWKYHCMEDLPTCKVKVLIEYSNHAKSKFNSLGMNLKPLFWPFLQLSVELSSRVPNLRSFNQAAL